MALNKVKLRLKQETEEETALKQKYEQLRRKKEEKERARLAKEGGEAAGAAGGADDGAAGGGGGAGGASDAPGGGGGRDAPTPAPNAGTPRAAPPAFTPAPAPRPAAEEAARPRVLSSKEDVAALLARKRGQLAAASATPGGAAGGDSAPTPAPALKRPGISGATPGSGAGSDKRPVIKRPAMRTPATGDPKRSKLGPGGGDDERVSRMWDKVLGGGGDGGAAGLGMGGLRPLPSADAHLRRVYVSDLPSSIDALELRNSMLRYGGVEDVRLDAHTGTAFITFNDVERAKKLVALSEEYDEGVGAPVLVAETPVRVQWATPPAAAGADGAADGAAGGAMLPPGALPPSHAVMGLSKQEQLDYAVRTAVQTYSHIGGPPPIAPRPADRTLVTYEDI